MLRFVVQVCCLIAIIAPGNAYASTEPAIDAELPKLDVPTKKLGDARKYVVFHKSEVTVQQAEADLNFCYRFVPHGVARKAPGFIPWGEQDPTNEVRYDGGNFGLVGLGIASIISGPLERSIRQSRLYRCMVPRGYARYRTSEEVWKLLNDVDGKANIALQAKIAAGPKPPTESIEP